jgi:hypothetical protein
MPSSRVLDRSHGGVTRTCAAAQGAHGDALVATETKTDVMNRRNPMLTQGALLTHIHRDSAIFPFFAGRTYTRERDWQCHTT